LIAQLECAGFSLLYQYLTSIHDMSLLLAPLEKTRNMFAIHWVYQLSAAFEISQAQHMLVQLLQ
jgi:hypothetical protein